MPSEPRLFMSADVKAVWPPELPPARLIAEEDRHITLAFLGNVAFPAMDYFPLPSFLVGLAGSSTEWLFLTHVIAANWNSPPQVFLDYQALVVAWLKEQSYPLHDKRPFRPHITVARGDFAIEEWKKIPCQIPFYISAISLKESLGYSEYKTHWSHPLIPPLEEIEHTADIAFLIRGGSYPELAHHAQLALAFHYPPMIPYLHNTACSSLDTLIAHLNQLIATADSEIGVPFKAVSYHTQLSQTSHFLEWRMIIDV